LELTIKPLKYYSINLKKMRTIIFFLFLVTLSVDTFCQNDSVRLSGMTREEILKMSQDELLEMNMEDLVFLSQKLGVSIDELLNMKTSVASKTVSTPRETPGIISILSAEEIKYSGARDLIDVLRLIPGFDFGYDVQGVVGVGLRGNWVHEGKLLLLIDGQQMNELSYFNFAFGNHIPVDQIKRIEIIRGPGSVIYGGNAELGVVNIITKTGKDTHGAEVSATYGQLQKSMGRTNVNLNTGFTTGAWDFSANGFLGNANRSDQRYRETLDDAEHEVDLSKGGSEIKTHHLNLGASNENLSFRLIFDDYKTRYCSYMDSLVGNVATYEEFRSVLGEVKYNLRINKKLTLVPKFNYKYSRPYYEKNYWRNFYINRYNGNMTLNYEMTRNTTVVAGVEWQNDAGKCIEDSGIFFINNKGTFNIINTSAFAEGTIKLSKVNIIAGGRIEKNSQYGWAMVPRIGTTAVFNKFHFKALFSGAFRSPGIGNIDVGKDIVPEKCFVSELELGYRINNYMFMTANLYDIKLSHCIIYFDDAGLSVPGVDWGYKNADNSGTDGLELEFKARYSKGYAAINYSYYTQAFRSLPESYAVPGSDNKSLGLSPHKIGLNCNYMPVKNLSIGPSFSILGKKYGFNAIDNEGNALIGEFGPYFLLNLSVTWDHVFFNGLSFSLSAYDILNQMSPFLQPYDGWYAPYPGSSREILFKIFLSTDLFKKN
jgi:outer membrane cobalamin receptor